MSHRFYFMYESTSLMEILPSLTRSMEEFKDTVCIFKEEPNTHVWKGKGQDLSSWQYLQTSTDILNRGILLGAFTLSEGLYLFQVLHCLLHFRKSSYSFLLHCKLEHYSC